MRIIKKLYSFKIEEDMLNRAKKLAVKKNITTSTLIRWSILEYLYKNEVDVENINVLEELEKIEKKVK